MCIRDSSPGCEATSNKKMIGPGFQVDNGVQHCLYQESELLESAAKLLLLFSPVGGNNLHENKAPYHEVIPGAGGFSSWFLATVP
eukprot:5783225-Amphidinium_carterae.1